MESREKLARRAIAALQQLLAEHGDGLWEGDVRKIKTVINSLNGYT